MPIIDASVLASYLVRDEFFEDAREILYTADIIIPDLIVPEVANVIWKHVYLYHRINVDEALELINNMNILIKNLEVVSSIKVIGNALKIAVEIGITVYDAIYLALIIDKNEKLKTFDEKLKDKIKNSIYKKYIGE